MKLIVSRDNRYIKECHKLKQRKYRELTGLFAIEGFKMLEEALAYAPNKIKYVLVDETINYQVEAGFDGEVYAVSHPLMQEISDTKTPQGIIAVVEKPQRDLENTIQDNSLLVLLDALADPGNMGTIIRTAGAFDVGGLLLTKGSVDPFSPKVIRSTMGGIFNLPIFEDITISNIEALIKTGFNLVSTTLGVATNYDEYDYKQPTIVVIGNEAHGVSPKLLKLSQIAITIPLKPEVDSLNAAVACGIIINEAWRQRYR